MPSRSNLCFVWISWLAILAISVSGCNSNMAPVPDYTVMADVEGDLDDETGADNEPQGLAATSFQPLNRRSSDTIHWWMYALPVVFSLLLIVAGIIKWRSKSAESTDDDLTGDSELDLDEEIELEAFDVELAPEEEELLFSDEDPTGNAAETQQIAENTPDIDQPPGKYVAQESTPASDELQLQLQQAQTRLDFYTNRNDLLKIKLREKLEKLKRMKNKLELFADRNNRLRAKLRQKLRLVDELNEEIEQLKAERQTSQNELPDNADSAHTASPQPVSDAEQR